MEILITVIILATIFMIGREYLSKEMLIAIFDKLKADAKDALTKSIKEHKKSKARIKELEKRSKKSIEDYSPSITLGGNEPRMVTSSQEQYKSRLERIQRQQRSQRDYEEAERKRVSRRISIEDMDRYMRYKYGKENDMPF